MKIGKSLVSAISMLLSIIVVAQVAAYQGNRDGRSSSFRWPAGKRAAISLTFDDARLSQIDAGLPVFERLGLKVTFYVSPNRLQQRLEGWRKAVAAGHEIGNHSLNHPCSGNFPFSKNAALEDYTLDRMREELIGANALIEKLLAVVPSTFAYPCGQKFVGRGVNVRSTVPLVASLFTAGRGFMDEAPNDPVFCDPAQLLGISCDNLTFEQVKPLVDQALERGHWLVFAGHEIGNSSARQTTQISMLESLAAYAQDPARGLWIDTLSNVGRYIARQRQTAADAEPVVPATREPAANS